MNTNIETKKETNRMSQLVFSYGYTASGKTTWCQTFLKKEELEGYNNWGLYFC